MSKAKKRFVNTQPSFWNLVLHLSRTLLLTMPTNESMKSGRLEQSFSNCGSRKKFWVRKTY